MRVALFFDGKNFYSGLKEEAPSQIIDFHKMSHWIVEHVGGSHLWGAYYYTGVETGPGNISEGQKKLSGFLDMLEFQPGFFVKRFHRKVHSFSCNHCGGENRFTMEKEVDTTMVADMLRLAAVNAFDILVLMSGDADHAPAVEGVRAIGKQVYVATWGKTGLSSRIRKVAFDHIDLLDGLSNFGSEGFSNDYPQRDTGFNGGVTPREDEMLSDPETFSDLSDVFVEELGRAEDTFQSGYVGMNYFLKRWQSDRMRISPEARRELLDQLVDEERVEIYIASDGNKAIRTKVADEELS